MKKMYLGIIFTVVGSLFLFGALLDHWDSENNDREHPSDIAVYQKMLFGISQLLGSEDSLSLNNKAYEIAQQFSIDLQISPLSSLALPKTYIGKLIEDRFLVIESDSKLIILHTLKNHPNMLVQLNLPIKQQDNFFIDMAMTLALYGGIVLMLLFWLLPLTTRLHKLTELAADFGKGDLSKRIRLSNFSYIDGLEKSFNQMASRIETLVADNKILAGSLSHDLRTPLACLRFGIDAAIDTNSQDKKIVYLDRVSADLTRLEEMLEAFLEYASLEQSGVSLAKRNINIHHLVLSLVEELQPLANDSATTLEVDMKALSTTTIYADNHWVYRALLNILSNALQHADSQIVIEISNGNNNMVNISVHDDGGGIKDIDVDAIFAPFRKGDQSRNRNHQNYGLGLAIAKKVIDWHEGSISAEKSTMLKGASFKMSLAIS